MPSRELFFAEGVAFTFLDKVQPLPDRKLPAASEVVAMMRAQWSAPLFIEGHLFGLGFALGKIVINSLHCKVDAAAMERVYGSGWDATQVIRGDIKPPPGCESLYNTLNEIQRIYLAELRQAAKLKLEQGLE
ncbi:hypothetical protein QBZ16_004792 [Prototheca wickerhamii]|uniref:Uncharacterized protein n=1 Tax=Prototheca wickerhamii TaxID=3111 RepID=A0AAD9IGE2_PROWI|nr:hypothetical protein QBZ16_004792 [Prototheca wickerhamii]